MKGYTHLSFRKMDDAGEHFSNRRKSHRCSLSFDKAISRPYFCMRCGRRMSHRKFGYPSHGPVDFFPGSVLLTTKKKVAHEHIKAAVK
ncbi:hypothetical protein HanRHA438_Chr02g0081551 [Helianthus annuus]|nr:hypothetical protein HanRHA438_Chr02g0081551 [Helianthus annuus]